MEFSKCNLKISYTSHGEDAICKNIIPLLSHAKKYKRSVGFFSSSVFNLTEKHIVDMVRNGGSMQLITSPILSVDDVEAIKYGTKLKEDVVKDNFIMEFEKALNTVEGHNQKLIIELIAKGFLDIRIVTTKKIGQYHDKIGIVEDNYGNVFTFVGSPNESQNGFLDNYEKIRLNFSWDSTSDRVLDEVNEFDSLWEGTNPNINTYTVNKAIQESIIKIKENSKQKSDSNSFAKVKELKPRPYQEEAIQCWKNLNYNGFFLMATGTGKTLTSLFAMKSLFGEKGRVTVVISAPYLHLLSQWRDDVIKIFPDSKVILASSENPNWESMILRENAKQDYNNKHLFIIVTLKTMKSQRFSNTISDNDMDKLLLIDEAHRFSNSITGDYSMYKYKLGLSATPYTGFSKDSGERLISFFGGKAYEFGLQEAIEKKYLVEYNYFPIFLSSTLEEEEKFKQLSRRMTACFKNGILIASIDRLSKLKRARLRILSSLEAKRDNFNDIISKINNKKNFIVYCGDGKVYNEKEDEVKLLNLVKNILNSMNLKTSQFTHEENINDRISRIELFNNGEIDALIAIKCLDEGINIPSIKSALIMSSNDDPREFIQRRGRILRTFEDKNGCEKKYADIYDVIVLPSLNCKGIAEIEFRRFKEYNSMAKNKEDNDVIFGEYFKYYDLDETKLFFGSSDYTVEDEVNLDG